MNAVRLPQPPRLIHTEQFILAGNRTTIMMVDDAAPIIRSAEIPLPDAAAALRYQQGVMETPMGIYNAMTNSCVTHRGNVLRAGGT
jgi:hypothetical protein